MMRMKLLVAVVDYDVDDDFLNSMPLIRFYLCCGLNYDENCY